MKTISVVIPTFNEEDNVNLAYKKVKKVFLEQLQEYRYEIIFIDNCSKVLKPDFCLINIIIFAVRIKNIG